MTNARHKKSAKPSTSDQLLRRWKRTTMQNGIMQIQSLTLGDVPAVPEQIEGGLGARGKVRNVTKDLRKLNERERHMRKRAMAGSAEKMDEASSEGAKKEEDKSINTTQDVLDMTVDANTTTTGTDVEPDVVMGNADHDEKPPLKKKTSYTYSVSHSSQTGA